MKDLPAQPRIAALTDAEGGRSLNIFRTVARHGQLYKAFLTLGGHLLGEASLLPVREREIVILRVGWRCGAEYEFGQHTRIGIEAGMAQHEVERLALESTDGWEDRDFGLVTMVDELCADDVVSDATWRELSASWNEQQLLELLVLIGFYRLVSGLLNSVGVALEPGTPGWPEVPVPPRRAPRSET
jgi:4-carboxymuconolactone decarboxylase